MPPPASMPPPAKVGILIRCQEPAPPGPLAVVRGCAPMSSLPPPPRRLLFGLALVCAANLLLEVSLTRIFSALMFYHFTFFAIAVALLGMGASGVWVYAYSE